MTAFNQNHLKNMISLKVLATILICAIVVKSGLIIGSDPVLDFSNANYVT